MHRIDTSGATPGGLFQMGNPAIGQQATLIDADWLNGVQENLVEVIEAAGIDLAKGDNAQLLQAIRLVSRLGGSTPGGLMFFPFASAPAGFLKANGAAISRVAYAELFTAYGTTFGAGDGATTFNLPDMRGEFVRAFDDGRGVDIGRALRSAQASQNLAHRHPAPSASTPDYGPFEVCPPAGFTAGGVVISGFAAYDFTGTGGSIAFTDYDGGSEARPRNVAWLACIKY
jgi:microcystin-dependent protein